MGVVSETFGRAWELALLKDSVVRVTLNGQEFTGQIPNIYNIYANALEGMVKRNGEKKSIDLKDPTREGLLDPY